MGNIFLLTIVQKAAFNDWLSSELPLARPLQEVLATVQPLPVYLSRAYAHDQFLQEADGFP